MNDFTWWIIGGIGGFAVWALLSILGAERERRVTILRAEIEERISAEQQKHLVRKRL